MEDTVFTVDFLEGISNLIGFDTSATYDSTVLSGKSPDTKAVAAASDSSLRPSINTVAPSSANLRAVASPIPRDAPVMTAIFL